MNDFCKGVKPLQKLPKNVEDLGKLIVAKGLKSFPKLKITQSGHTRYSAHTTITIFLWLGR